MKRTLVLIWDYSSPNYPSIARLLESPLFDIASFTRGEDAITYLREAKRAPHAVLLPDSVPLAQRLAFLQDFRRQAPALFFELPVLLITSIRALPEVYPIKHRRGFNAESAWASSAPAMH